MKKENNTRKIQNFTDRPKIKKKNNNNLKLEKADLNSSSINEDEIEEKDKFKKILKRGEKEELQTLIDNFTDDINSYAFGENKTLLLEAVIICPNPDIIDIIMKKNADINKGEFQTGNSPIFLCALDLKVEFVERLLKYKPNLKQRNKAGQNIFEFLNYQLFEQRKKFGRELTEEENGKYEKIEEMLQDYI